MAKIIIDKQIVDLQKKRGITQEQIAAAMNASSQAMSKWEFGVYYMLTPHNNSIA